MKKVIFWLFALPALLLLRMPQAWAHCPLCTIAVGSAAASASYYGFDPSLIGLMLGAFGISTGLWFALVIERRYGAKVPFQKSVLTVSSLLLTVMPLLYINNDMLYLPILLGGEPGTLLNKVYWIPKMLFGSAFGALLTIIAYWTHVRIKAVRGKVLFPYQGVALTVMALGLGWLGLYFIV
ncbi:hypothetical protein HYV81_04475 [Candidatus Woesearchaeota archaeon]|nr:hypothetical protein [Candidatus Woesearchaeota archaeon]